MQRKTRIISHPFPDILLDWPLLFPFTVSLRLGPCDGPESLGTIGNWQGELRRIVENIVVAFYWLHTYLCPLSTVFFDTKC